MAGLAGWWEVLERLLAFSVVVCFAIPIGILYQPAHSRISATHYSLRSSRTLLKHSNTSRDFDH